MATPIPNTIKFHQVKCNEMLRFKPPMFSIPSIAISTGSNEGAHSLLILITDQEKEKYIPHKLLSQLRAILIDSHATTNF